MRMRAPIASILLAFLCAGAVSAQDWRGGKARIDGIVKNAKGEPVEGCKVTLRWGKSSHGGPDLTTAFITLSSSGRLVRTTWPRAGAPLHHLPPPAA